MNKKVIGLIGGMGPYASAYFYNLLLQKSGQIYGAQNNDDYPEIVIDSVPVPDFISDTNKLGVARDILISRVETLNQLNCSVIGMVCNTAHILFDELSRLADGALVSMIELVAKRASEIKLKRVGILVTPTAIKMKLYENSLSKFGIKAINDTREMQRVHEEIIRDNIAGRVNASAQRRQFYRSVKKFIRDQHLDGIILGCTELPLIFPKDDFENVIDCMDVLADELLVRYYNQNEKSKF